MFDWIRNLTKSAAEKQHEMLTAYVDDELSAADRGRFEQMMAADEALRAEVARQHQFKLAILRHKTDQWSEISRDDCLASLDALKELALAPSPG